MKRYFSYILLILVIIIIGSNFIQNPIVSLPEADYILVEKEKRILSLYRQNQLIKQYKIALGFSPIGHKKQEGDGKTPEGKYYIISKNPRSSYHLSLKISYPSDKDMLAAQTDMVNPGGDIMIHAIRKGLGWIGRYHRLIDWTQGCIAVTNSEIEEIYSATKVGIPIEIKP